MEYSAILSTFIKLPVVIKIFVLSIFEWPFYTGLTVSLFQMREVLAGDDNLEVVPEFFNLRNMLSTGDQLRAASSHTLQVYVCQF